MELTYEVIYGGRRS